MSDQSGSTDARTRLEVLVGQWEVKASFPESPIGTATIEWELDRRFLIWRVTVPDPSFPDSLSIISINSDGETFTQHYFDDRGIVRTYKMTLEADTWTLLRDEPDFSPLAFSQRFTATINVSGAEIRGVWESASSPDEWTKDFDLVYRKTALPN